MAQMTDTQLSEFLAPPRHAILATNRADGPPQLTPVWYIYDQRGEFERGKESQPTSVVG